MRSLTMPGTFDFTAVLAPQLGGGYIVSVPALPEVVTEGETEAEARAMAEEVTRAILEYRCDEGITILGAAPPTASGLRA